jgi:hypothetical protein
MIFCAVPLVSSTAYLIEGFLEGDGFPTLGLLERSRQPVGIRPEWAQRDGTAGIFEMAAPLVKLGTGERVLRGIDRTLTEDQEAARFGTDDGPAGEIPNAMDAERAVGLDHEESLRVSHDPLLATRSVAGSGYDDLLILSDTCDRHNLSTVAEKRGCYHTGGSCVLCPWA